MCLNLTYNNKRESKQTNSNNNFVRIESHFYLRLKLKLLCQQLRSTDNEDGRVYEPMYNYWGNFKDLHDPRYQTRSQSSWFASSKPLFGCGEEGAMKTSTG